MYILISIGAIAVGGYLFLSRGYLFDIPLIIGCLFVGFGFLIVYDISPLSGLLDNSVVSVIVLFIMCVFGYYTATMNPRLGTFILLGGGSGVLFYGFVRDSVLS